MSPVTPTYQLPYPALSEPADVPADMQELVNRLEVVLAGIAAVPTGFIGPFGGTNPPAGWLLCDGAAVSRTTYAGLFAVVGTSYGAGDGTSTFNTPNLRGKVPVMLDAGQAEFNALGKTGGAKAVALALAELAAHSHVVNSHSHGGATGTDSPDHGHSGSTDGQGSHNHSVPGNFATGAITDAGAGSVRTHPTGTATLTDPNGYHSHNVSVGGATARHAHAVGAEAPGTNAQGGGVAHQNMPPFLVVNAIIKT